MKHAGGHQLVLNSIFIGLYFQGCSTQIHSRGKSHSFTSDGLELKCAQHFLPKKLRFMGHCQYQHMLAIT